MKTNVGKGSTWRVILAAPDGEVAAVRTICPDGAACENEECEHDIHGVSGWACLQAALDYELASRK